MTIWARLKKNVVTILSGSLLASVFGLVGLSIITKSIGTEAFGFFILMTVAVEIVNRLFNFQTWQAYIKFAPECDGAANEKLDIMQLTKLCFCLDFLSLLLAAVIAFVGVPFFNDFFSVPEEYHLASYLMCCLLFFHVFEMTTGIFRYFDEFGLQTYILVFFSFAKMIAYFMASFFYSDLYAFVYATLFVSSINIFLQFFFAIRVLKDRGYLLAAVVSSKISYAVARGTGVLSFVWHNNIDSSVRMVSRRLDIILLGKLVSSEAVALYKVVQELGGILGRLTAPLYQALYPEFSKMVADGKKSEIYNVTSKIMLCLLVVALSFYCIYLGLGEYVVELVFGEKYVGSYQYSLLYLVAVLIDVVTLPFVPLMFSFGLAEAAVKNQILATLFYIAALFLLIESYQVWGACLAYIVFYILWSSFTFHSLRAQWVAHE